VTLAFAIGTRLSSNCSRSLQYRIGSWSIPRLVYVSGAGTYMCDTRCRYLMQMSAVDHGAFGASAML
jgi:hypothetical protein